jgi:hypothetical protein
MDEPVTLQSIARQGEHGINRIDAVRAGGSY